MAELAAVQSWLQRAIFAGGADAEFADGLVRGDAGLAAAARVGIYAAGYRARLLDCLRGEYPVLRQLAGETAFDLFAQDYVAACPSTGRDLYGFGAAFPDHLAARQPADAREPASPLAVPAELARLERARAEVQRAVGVEQSASIVGADCALVPGARLRLPDSVRLLRLEFDLVPLIEAADRGERPELPRAAETHVAVARSAYRVRIHALEPWRSAFLAALGPRGADVQEAAAASARRSGRDVGETLADLAIWLPLAAQLGLVAPA